jgi:hypothetical protein
MDLGNVVESDKVKAVVENDMRPGFVPELHLHMAQNALGALEAHCVESVLVLPNQSTAVLPRQDSRGEDLALVDELVNVETAALPHSRQRNSYFRVSTIL